ncbi:hypothetical protein ABIF68_006817 [Bradyrhizobium japonicum]
MGKFGNTGEKNALNSSECEMVMETRVALSVEQRRNIAAVISRMMVTCFLAMQRQYGDKHLGASALTLIIDMMIRVNDAEGRRSTIIGIARQLDMARSSVRPSILELLEHGSIKRNGGDGFTVNDDYMRTRIDPESVADIPLSIIAAGEDLKRLLGDDLRRLLDYGKRQK